MVRRTLTMIIVALLVALVASTTLAQIARYALPGDDLFPEGIGAQASTGDFFVGSTTSGTVLRGNIGSPTVEEFLPGGSDGRTDVRGIKVDARGRLYLAGGATGQIFVYDTASKQVLATFATGLNPSFVNNATIAPDGAAYFTDSRSPVIYRVAPDVTSANAFERWIDLAGSPIVYGDGFNLNGIAASADGRYLVTVQSNTGKLFRITTATKQVTEVKLDGQTLEGGDGMLLDGRTLYVLRNQAATLVTLQLSPDFTSATVANQTTNANFDFPTTFARIGDQLLVVNSQLNKRQANQAPNLPFAVLNVPVPVVPGLPSTGADAPLMLRAVFIGALALLVGGLVCLAASNVSQRRLAMTDEALRYVRPCMPQPT